MIQQQTAEEQVQNFEFNWAQYVKYLCWRGFYLNLSINISFEEYMNRTEPCSVEEKIALYKVSGDIYHKIKQLSHYV